MKIVNHIKKIWHLLKETFNEFIDDNAIKLSASLSYYTIFSLPPLLIIIISLCGFFFGAEAVRGELFGQINGLVGNDAALQIQEAIKNVKLSGSSAFATTVGIIILLIGAAFTAFLFMIGKFAIGAYLGSSAVASIYGAAGSVILILVWVYYSAIILYFGAEFTKVYALAHGKKIIPNQYSVRIEKVKN
ncbi:MAG: YihY/virulence factor BrkB family protein [Bacteroidia bacterium]